MASWFRCFLKNPKQCAVRASSDPAPETKDERRKRPSREGQGSSGTAAVEYYGLFDDSGAIKHHVPHDEEEWRAGQIFAVDSLPAPSLSWPIRSPSLPLRVVVISDTHEFHHHLTLPPGDILIHCGDILTIDRFTPSCMSNYNLRHFFKWFNEQPFSLRVIIAGNHDKQIEELGRDKVRAMAAPSIYLENEMLDVGGLRIFALPRSKPNSSSSGNKAFQTDDPWPKSLPDMVFVVTPTAPPTATVAARNPADKDDDGITKKTTRARAIVPTNWTITPTARSQLPDPNRLDFLMTHGAPSCRDIRQFVAHMNPAVHFCGHVHESHGLWLVDRRSTPSKLRLSRDRDVIGHGSDKNKNLVVSLNAATVRGGMCKEWLEAALSFDYVVSESREPSVRAALGSMAHPVSQHNTRRVRGHQRTESVE